MTLKIALPVIAGLTLTLFSFKPVSTSKITRLANGNFELKGVNISDTDLKALNELANSSLIFKKTITKDKDASKVTESVASTNSLASGEDIAKVSRILSKYEF